MRIKIVRRRKYKKTENIGGGQHRRQPDTKAKTYEIGLVLRSTNRNRREQRLYRKDELRIAGAYEEEGNRLHDQGHHRQSARPPLRPPVRCRLSPSGRHLSEDSARGFEIRECGISGHRFRGCSSLRKIFRHLFHPFHRLLLQCSSHENGFRNGRSHQVDRCFSNETRLHRRRRGYI